MSSDTQMTPRWHEKNIPSGALDHQANCIETRRGHFENDQGVHLRLDLFIGLSGLFSILPYINIYKWLQIEARKNRLVSSNMYMFICIWEIAEAQR